MAAYPGLFEIVVHWKGSRFCDHVVMSNRISKEQCDDILAACLKNARAPTQRYTGTCDGASFRQDNAAEILRDKVVRLEFPGDAGNTIHLFPADA